VALPTTTKPTKPPAPDKVEIEPDAKRLANILRTALNTPLKRVAGAKREKSAKNLQQPMRIGGLMLLAQRRLA
jgi:hypothetical protein